MVGAAYYGDRATASHVPCIWMGVRLRWPVEVRERADAHLVDRRQSSSTRFPKKEATLKAIPAVPRQALLRSCDGASSAAWGVSPFPYPRHRPWLLRSANYGAVRMLEPMVNRTVWWTIGGSYEPLAYVALCVARSARSPTGKLGSRTGDICSCRWMRGNVHPHGVDDGPDRSVPRLMSLAVSLNRPSLSVTIDERAGG
jgi:hypothetical protein